jgi:hypothetical protein
MIFEVSGGKYNITGYWLIRFSRYTSESQWSYGAAQQIWRTYKAIDVPTPDPRRLRMINDLKCLPPYVFLLLDGDSSHPCLKDLNNFLHACGHRFPIHCAVLL